MGKMSCRSMARLSTRPSGQVGCQATAVVMATWVLPLSAYRICALKVRSFKDQSLRNACQHQRQRQRQLQLHRQRHSHLRHHHQVLHRRRLMVVLAVLWRSVSNCALVMRVGTKLARRSVDHEPCEDVDENSPECPAEVSESWHWSAFA